MPKIILQQLVKYDGKKIPANTPFECAKEDLEQFVLKGCHIFEEEIKETKSKKTDKAE